MQIQLAKETRQLPVEKNIQWPVVLVFDNLPEGNMISEYARIRILTLRIALEIAKSGENLVSDRKVGFSRNLGCALADFYGHYSPRDLQILISSHLMLIAHSLISRSSHARRMLN